jgi:hypothetical protein
VTEGFLALHEPPAELIRNNSANRVTNTFYLCKVIVNNSLWMITTYLKDHKMMI